jgi:protein TonB
MHELKPRPTVSPSKTREALGNPLPRKLLLALVLLLVALAAVVVTDRRFWFGSEQSDLDSDVTPAVASRTKQAPSAARQPQSQPTPASAAKKHAPAATSAQPKSAVPPVVATTRTVLPPLNVEVVAGDSHRTIHPGMSKIEIANAPNANPVTDAAGRERISAEAAPEASYPLLGQHMNVQGSVVLKAVIGADGTIENLHVLSGPAILAVAAQQAVREWHFKPVLQNGQPVETMAKIVVNFSIKVGDNSEKTTLAESRADGLLIFTR